MIRKAHKAISGRELRRGTPEEKLTPGESILIHKQGGKVFQLRRVDSGEKGFIRQLDELLADTANSNQQVPTDFSRVILEDRE
jgi:hypothetical protein